MAGYKRWQEQGEITGIDNHVETLHRNGLHVQTRDLIGSFESKLEQNEIP